MKTIIIKHFVFAIIVLLSASTLWADPIYMKYEGIDGSVSTQVEVRNGKAVCKKLKPGTYRVSLIFTGKDAKTSDGKPRTQAHVKVFDGTTSFSGGVRVASGDVNGDGRSDYGGGGSTGKVQMQDFHFSAQSMDGKSSRAAVGAGKVSLQDIHLALRPNGSELLGQLGTIQITPPEGSKRTDSFFDVFTELSLD